MRPIDADALVAKLEDDSKHMEDNLAVMFTYAAINDIKRAPTVDAVEVVRCKDCEYYTALDDNGGRCNLHKITSYVNCFCSWAERRKDG